MKKIFQFTIILLAILCLCSCSFDTPTSKGESINITYQTFLDGFAACTWDTEPNFNYLNDSEKQKFIEDSVGTNWAIVLRDDMVNPEMFYAMDINKPEYVYYQRLDGTWFVKLQVGINFQTFELNSGDSPYPKPLKNTEAQNEALKFLEIEENYQGEMEITHIDPSVVNLDVPEVDANGVPIRGISDYAFYEAKLNTIRFSSALTDIPINLIHKVSNFSVNPENKKYKSSNSCLLSKDGKVLYAGCKDATIPYGVSTIRDNAFMYTDLETIVIPDGVISIGNSAFKGCRELISVRIPSSVELIGNSAFADCSKLESVLVPGSVSCLSDCVFYNCTALSNVIIQEGVNTIRDNAFAGTALKSIRIPSSVSSIEGSSLPTGNMESIELAEGNKNYVVIDNCLIDTTQDLLVAMCRTSSIPTDGSVKKLGSFSIMLPSEITEFTIPSVIESIRNEAFGAVKNVTVIVPSGMDISKWYGSWLGGENNKIIYTDIPKDMQDNDQYGLIINTSGISAYLKKNAKGDVVLPSGTYHGLQINSLINMDGNYIFYRNIDSLILPEGLEYIGMHAINSTTLKTLILPESLKELEYYAINCSSLESLNIPKNVEDIGWSAIDCEDIGTLTVDTENKVYHSAGNCIIKTAEKELVSGCKNSVIPADGSVTKIYEEAFRSKPAKELIIPSTITEIGRWAFFDWPMTSRIIIRQPSYGIIHTDPDWLYHCEAVPEYISE